MSAVMYREFTLTNNNVWNALKEIIKANAKSFADKGSPLRIIVTSEEKKRNAEQNRMYWGGILRQISDQAWVSGQQYTTDTWHEYFARKHGVCEDVTLPGGEVVVRRKSTTQMSVGEFSEYMTRVQADAASSMGVDFA
jgi:hypothetical protein